MNSLKKTILITIELSDRELLSKCFLAYFLLKRGFRVYIGPVRGFYEFNKKISSCIFFHKSTLDKHVEEINEKLGATFCILDEEAGVAIPRSKITDFIENRYSQVDKRKYQHVFSIGERWESAMNSNKRFEGVHVHATGWPRVDLWRPEFSFVHGKVLGEIIEKYGKFILFVSSFGATDSAGFFELEKHDRKLFGNEFNGQSKEKFEKNCEMLKYLSKTLLDDEKIIIRPHPSEKISDWKRIFNNYGNIFVCREGDVSPWILAASNIIQFRSTTGIQAALNGKLSLAYKHSKVAGVTDTAVFEINQEFNSYSELKSALLLGEDRANVKVDFLHDEISSLSGELASSKIASVLDEITLLRQGKVSFSSLGKYIYSVKLSLINFYQYIKVRLGVGGIVRTEAEKRPGGITKELVERHLNELFPSMENKITVCQVLEDVVELDYNDL